MKARTSTNKTPTITHQLAILGSTLVIGIISAVGAVPVITIQPSPINTILGSTVKFTVAATGNAPLQYQWRINGTDLHSGGAFSGANSNSLTISSMRNYYVGSYDVIVSNAEGATTSSPASLRLSVATWPGSIPKRQIQAMCFTNSRAFVSAFTTAAGSTEGLYILDTSNPTNCVELGNWPVSSWAGGIAVRGQYVYLQAGTALQVLDVSNPSNPFLVGTYPVGGDLAFSGSYLYVAAGTNLFILSAANPTNLVQVGQIPVNADKVIVDGNYAYTISTSIASSPLTIINIQDPANPQRASWYDLSSWTPGFSKKGNYILIANQDSDLLILDVSNPRNPSFVSSTYLLSTPEDVAIIGNYALVACYWWGLSVVNIANPSNPYEVAFYYTSTPYTSANGMIHAVKTDGRNAYLDTDYGLQVLDVSNPLKPVRVGGELSIVDVAVQGNVAYLIDSMSGLQTIDITDPMQPRQLGAFDFYNYARAVAVSGSYAYVADDNALYVFDVSNPMNPIPRGTNSFASGSGPNTDLEYDIAVRSNRVFVGTGLTGLRIFDVSNPARPTAISVWTNSSLGVALDSAYAYVANGNSYYGGNKGLEILNIANLNQPVKLSDWSTSTGYACRVASSSNYVYLADGSSGLQVFDVTDRSSPFRTANVATTAYDVVLAGNRAYLAGSGLLVLDLSNPTSPFSILRTNTPGGGRALAVSGNYAYLADGPWGLSVVPLPVPPGPARLANTRVLNGAFRFDVLGTTNGNYAIQSATNLNAGVWVNLITNAAPFSYTNAMSPGSPIKFYRAISRP